MDESVIQSALMDLFRQGIGNRILVHGVALGLSMSGRSRLDIMRFFWDFMTRHELQLGESQMDMVGDYCFDLLGRGPIEHIVRLCGDPEDTEELVNKVDAEARMWKVPT